MDRETRFIAYHHRDIISDIQIHPIFPSERERWDTLIRQHHYLGLKSMVGCSTITLTSPIADRFSKSSGREQY